MVQSSNFCNSRINIPQYLVWIPLSLSTRVESSLSGEFILTTTTIALVLVSELQSLSFQCSSIGATNCYLLSSLVATKLVHKYLPDRAAQFSKQVLVLSPKSPFKPPHEYFLLWQVQRQKDSLLYYIIFLRVTPFLPNWFINVVSPVIDVPLTPFFLGTFLGESHLHVILPPFLKHVISDIES